jgi:ubiquitin-protein ligase
MSSITLKFSPQHRKKIIINMYKQLRIHPQDYMDFVIMDKDINTWYVMIHGIIGNQDEYVGGKYLFKLTIPPNFPAEVFSFECLTPNGVYEPGGRICISIGEWHQSDGPSKKNSDHGYTPARDGGPDKFVREITNGLIIRNNDILEKNKSNKGLESGIRIKFESIDVTKKMALESDEYNRKLYPKIMEEFDGLRVNKVRVLCKAIEKHYGPNIIRSIKKIMKIPLDC